MADDFNNDPFGGVDPFDVQQTMTPGFNSFKTTGTNKLLVVLFIVDCSRSMDGERIMAVNAALTEVKSILQDIKNDNGLDLKIAIMSFTSSAKWELQLTDIDEVSLENLKTRPGLTEYGNAFHELNKVLRKERFMKHTGKIAPPAIMFLTDGGPTDDYETDLEDLLKNEWFVNASRSAVLLGDAIHDDAAKNAVKRFVEDPDRDIVDAENSTVIIQKIKKATMHTVAGDPMDKGNTSGEIDMLSDMITSYKKGVLSGTDTLTGGDDLFGGAGSTDGDDPFGGTLGGDDPFGGVGSTDGDDPFGEAGSTDGDDPFGGTGSTNGDDPFGGILGGDNPFGGTESTDGDDPFGGTGSADGDDPFGGTGSTDGGDPFGETGGTGGSYPLGGRFLNDPF